MISIFVERIGINFAFDKQEKTAYKISGMLVWAMSFVLLEAGALKQWFKEYLSDTIWLQMTGSIATGLEHAQL